MNILASRETNGRRPCRTSRVSEPVPHGATEAEPLPLEDVAREVSLSRRQIERLFAEYLKTTPWQHCLTLRLQKAKQLLEMTNMPVIGVAVACGYVSSSHFSKSFKDHFQILPSAARMAATSPSSRSAA
ncbi:helix-turn-helix domain-containing protein [Mesorhizobium yinganensis]|uniref:helix-turn-helix domain-containing protein n=1 Tax=Mesorhizobium yinganensis TaxID=3157707 RepID=UPI003CCCCB93